MESLGYLALIWFAVFLSNVISRKIKLTPVLMFLAFGSILVNIGLMPTTSDGFISGLAELGIILIMFALGFEEDTSNFLASLKKSWGIAFFGAVAPFAVAYMLADYFWNDGNIALMCGLTMTATAVSLTMLTLQDAGLGKSPVATRIMTSAVIDDIASLALIAVLVPIASGKGTADLGSLLVIVGKVITFFVVVVFLGATLFPHKLRGRFAKIPFLNNYGVKHLLSFGRHSTLTVLLLALVVGLLAHEFGFHPAVGAYMAGLILKKEYFLMKDRKGSYEDTNRIISNAAFSWIGPVFFVELGTHLVFDGELLLSVMPYAAAMVAGIFVVQIASAGLAAYYTGGMNGPDSLMIGFGMLGRAELAFVVMDIAYVDNQILSTEAFYTLMVTAFLLNVLVPITISFWKPYCTLAESETKAN